MEQVRTENKMGTMPIGKLLANMAIPMMVSMLVQAFYNVVDSVYVSQLNENALSAISLAFPLQNLMIAFGSGTAVGTNALLSRALGAKRHDLVDRAANTSIFLMFCNFAVFCVLGLTLSRSFFLAQTDVSQIVEYGTSYTSICLGASIGIFAQFCFERLLQSTGRTKLAMYTQITGAVINIILDPILIFGWFGLPRLEVKGAAIATVAGQIIAAIIGLFVNLKKNPEIHIRAKLVRWHSATAGEIYRVGVPSIIMGSIGSVMTFGMNKILIAFTTTATAVFGAYFKLQSFIFMPVFGLNNAMVPILSYNYGARKPERVKKTVKLSIFTAIGIMILGFAAFELIPDVLLELFDASETMLSIGTTALRIIGTHFLIAGINVVAMSVYQAVGDPLYSLLSSVTRQLVVLLPAAWLLARTGRLELVWLAFPIAELAALAMSAIFLRKTLRTAECRMADDDYGEVV